MKRSSSSVARAVALAMFSGSVLPVVTAQAQERTPSEDIEEVTVVGSRIRSADMQGIAPVTTLGRDALEQQGLASIGDILQELTTSGSALNTRFNSSGNFGYPADAGGIGAGSAQIDLRHLGSKRVLVLVDGIRWVNESSASGVSTVVDLNTIPLSIIERVEVLEDGASAIYGSDAIAGVVNIITRRDFDGLDGNLYFGAYDEGDGETTRADLSFGSTGDDFSFFISVSYTRQEAVESSDRNQALFPVPGTGVTRGSSATPQGRFIFCDPRVADCSTPQLAGQNAVDLALNTGATSPVYDPANPTGGASTYHPFTDDDRFNFAPYNLVLTPNERRALFGQFRYQLSPGVQWYLKGLYNTRESVNRAAPEPIFLGPDAGTGGLADTVSISALNPYNPFGIDLVNGQNFLVLARRPVEGGPRIYGQNVDTYYFGTGFEGSFTLGGRDMFWDVNLVDARNRADQTARGNHNVLHIQQALGDPAVCAAIPGCVPLNLFGGEGTVTPEMLQWIQYVGTDKSENNLQLASANLTGELFDMWAGPLAFALGFEYRDYEGFFQPDSLKITGESNDIPAQPTSGSYDVKEVYLELNVPLLRDLPGAERLDLSLAGRYSDYSTFGGEETFKAGLRWQPIEDLVLRGTFAEGFRAPAIGELFGAATRFDAVLSDPCSNYPASADATIRANCAALGIPANYVQINPQISVITGGNAELEPETADSFTAGFVYTPRWAEGVSWSQRLSLEFTYYDHEIEGAIQAVDAETQLTQCVRTLDPAFCTGIERTPTGNISAFQNRLTNIGRIETDGFDVKLSWQAPDSAYGSFTVTWFNTFVNDFTALGATGEPEPRAEGVEVNDSAIPEWQSTLDVGWTRGSFNANVTVRHIDSVMESCSDFLDGTPNSFTALGLCSHPNPQDESLSLNELDATTYVDLRFGWRDAFGAEGLTLAVGLNNALDEDPPICLSCSLNGYDPSTYDLPGRFWYLQAGYRF